MNKNILLLLACLIIVSCGNQITTVSFSEPQPADKKALLTFPEKLKGKYISNDGAATLFVYDKLIVKVSDYEVGTKTSELDTNYYLSGNKLINKKNNEQEDVIIRGDSVLIHIHDEDTMANIANGDILKKFKGYYFLNKGNMEDGWIVTRLALTDGKLTTAYISDSTALNKLEELAEKPLDTIARQYSISKRKFKVLLKSDGFSDYDTFTRIR
jgi:hypothetical protein